MRFLDLISRYLIVTRNSFGGQNLRIDLLLTGEIKKGHKTNTVLGQIIESSRKFIPMKYVLEIFALYGCLYTKYFICEMLVHTRMNKSPVWTDFSYER